MGRSCPENRPKNVLREFGAGDRIRTGDIDLGKVALYQLSYSRPDGYNSKSAQYFILSRPIGVKSNRPSSRQPEGRFLPSKRSSFKMFYDSGSILTIYITY